MTILFGHPTGNPNSHNAALAHLESGRLEAFCVPWMPLPAELALLRSIPGIGHYAGRLERRYFPALASAPRIEGRVMEWWRMVRRIAFGGRFASEALSYEANDWLMETMRAACRKSRITAVHAYEDCSLLQFEEAKRLGKACLYDLPAGYYPAWERKQAELERQYEQWLPPRRLQGKRFVRPEQKRLEMGLADCVLVACNFSRATVEHYADRSATVVPYGVDLEFWSAGPSRPRESRLRFIYAGQCSLRKGLPVLLEAWKSADLSDATLDLVGSWQFDEARRGDLPANVSFLGPASAEALRDRYRNSDVFIFTSFFEGFGLVILEAMACALPVIASDACAGPDLLDARTGRVFAAGAVDELVESLRWFSGNRDRIPEMGLAARAAAENHGWRNYRDKVSLAVAGFA